MQKIIKINETDIKEIVREVLNSIGKKRVHEVKYFHPTGKSLPNGSNIQRGGFLHECKLNKESYVLDESVHGEQYGLADYKGGVITFSTDINALKMSNNAIVNKMKQFIETLKQRFNKDKILHNVITKFNKQSDEYIGAYSVGNFFKGKYVGDNGEMYDEKSLSIEINGLSTKSLVKVAEDIANRFRQETVLVKDLNTGKIFLVDGEPSDNPIETEMSRINTKV